MRILTLLALSVPGLAFAQRAAWTPAEGLPPAPGGNEQTTSVVADFDGDGTLDFVITDRSVAPSAWLYRRGGSGWERSVIEASKLHIEAGGATADIDGDGDVDLVLGQDWIGNELWWFENPSPEFDGPWTRRTIKSDGAKIHHDQAFGDFDGDGALELATWVNGAPELRVYEVPVDVRERTAPWPDYVSIPMPAGEGMHAADVDGDGRTDILAGGHWIPFTEDGYTLRPIDAEYTNSRIVAADLLPGGRLEVALASGDGEGPWLVYLYKEGRWSPQTLVEHMNHGHSLDAGDVDGDGHTDLFAAEMGAPGAGDEARAWIAWGDGAGGFELEIVSVGDANHMSRLADLDGDGDLDRLVKPYSQGAPHVEVLLNGPRKLDLTSWKRRVIDAAKPRRSIFLRPGDLDGDGDIDLATGGWWYANPGLARASWSRHELPVMTEGAWASDLDGDGDIDVFGTDGKGAGRSKRLLIATNDGLGNFETTELGPAAGDFLQGVAERARGSGVELFLSWHEAGHGVRRQTFGADTTNDVAHAHSEDEALCAGDIDGDGDLDLFTGSAWLREDADGWTRFEAFDPGALPPDRNRLGDVDGDGDLDAIVGYEGEVTPLIWAENPGGTATGPWTVHTIARELGGGFSLDVGDLDADGDLDVVLGEHRGKLRTLIYENLGEDRWQEHVIDDGTAGDHHDGTLLLDFDEDGDLDVFSIGWDHSRVMLLENRAVTSGAIGRISPAESLIYAVCLILVAMLICRR